MERDFSLVRVHDEDVSFLFSFEIGTIWSLIQTKNQNNYRILRCKEVFLE